MLAGRGMYRQWNKNTKAAPCSPLLWLLFYAHPNTDCLSFKSDVIFFIWENKFSVWVSTFACFLLDTCHDCRAMDILLSHTTSSLSTFCWREQFFCGGSNADVWKPRVISLFIGVTEQWNPSHTHRHTLKQMLPHHQTTYSRSHSHTGVILSVHSSWAACLWTVGGRVKRPEKSHADTQGTRKPHTEGTSCLGTELFISWGCDHFWAWCGINHMNLCVNASRAPDNAHSAWRRVKEVNRWWRTIRQLKKWSIEKCLEKCERCSQVFLNKPTDAFHVFSDGNSEEIQPFMAHLVRHILSRFSELNPLTLWSQWKHCWTCWHRLILICNEDPDSAWQQSSRE